jgi:hypothetical protein
MKCTSSSRFYGASQWPVERENCDVEIEDTGKSMNCGLRCVCKPTATRADHSQLSRPLYFPSCGAGKLLARSTRNPAAVCSHSLSGLISVRTHTLCTTLIPWKGGRYSKWVQPELLAPSTDCLNLSRIVSGVLPFFISARQPVKHLALYACVAVCWVCRARSGCWCNQQSVYLQHYVIFFVLSKLRYSSELTFYGINFFTYVNVI